MSIHDYISSFTNFSNNKRLSLRKYLKFRNQKVFCKTSEEIRLLYKAHHNK